MPPLFDAAFRATFKELVLWRRDVRRFRHHPVERAQVDALIALAAHAPSVGFSQPWRFVHVVSPQRRAAVAASFAEANARTLDDYAEERQRLYARLKLEGLKEAPIHLAVFADEKTGTGHGLGRQSMPETLRYSVVAAIQTLWLAARAEGLGVGWISILDPIAVKRALDVPMTWTLVAYLCIGWPSEEHLDSELERHQWEARMMPEDITFTR